MAQVPSMHAHSAYCVGPEKAENSDSPRLDSSTEEAAALLQAEPDNEGCDISSRSPHLARFKMHLPSIELSLVIFQNCRLSHLQPILSQKLLSEKCQLHDLRMFCWFQVVERCQYNAGAHWRCPDGADLQLPGRACAPVRFCSEKRGLPSLLKYNTDSCFSHC